MCIYTRRNRTCSCLTVSACHKRSLVFCLGISRQFNKWAVLLCFLFCCESSALVQRCPHRVLGLARMARRPSTVSVSSPSPLSAGLYQPSKGTSQLSPLPTFRTPTSPWPPRHASIFAPPRNLHALPVENPDELFTKMTVSEVMQVHRRLLCAKPLFTIDSRNISR